MTAPAGCKRCVIASTQRSETRILGDPGHLADLAVTVLREEALLTPKPGLVDRRGGGAHDDMTVGTLLASAEALRPAFAACTALGAGPDRPTLDDGPVRERRARLGVIGRAGEAAMLAATGGVNTHRGALWALGLLCAASGEVDRAAALAAIPDPAGRLRDSHGARARARHGAGGASDEAARGFPHVTDIALPALRAARARGADENSARLDALLALMATLTDTCLLHRGGRAGLEAVRSAAAAVLDAGGVGTSAGRRRLATLDRTTRDRRLSPGGSADLLAVTLMLDTLGVPSCRP